MTPTSMTIEAIRPVITNTKIIADMIFPKRRILVIPATAEEMEKKTRGTMAVKRRLRKISPKRFEDSGIFFKNNSENRADNDGYNQNN